MAQTNGLSRCRQSSLFRLLSNRQGVEAFSHKPRQLIYKILLVLPCYSGIASALQGAETNTSFWRETLDHITLPRPSNHCGSVSCVIRCSQPMKLTNADLSLSIKRNYVLVSDAVSWTWSVSPDCMFGRKFPPLGWRLCCLSYHLPRASSPRLSCSSNFSFISALNISSVPTLPQHSSLQKSHPSQQSA